MTVALRIRDAAHELGVGREAIRRMIRAGRLPARRVGGSVVILRSEFEKFAGELPPFRTPTGSVQDTASATASEDRKD